MRNIKDSRLCNRGENKLRKMCSCLRFYDDDVLRLLCFKSSPDAPFGSFIFIINPGYVYMPFWCPFVLWICLFADSGGGGIGEGELKNTSPF